MRGLVSAVLLGMCFVSSLGWGDQVGDFVSSCTKSQKIMSSQILCSLESADGNGELQFLMTQGQLIQLKGSGHYARIHRSLRVSDITPLGPRLSNVGALDSSVRFLARAGRTVITIDIPCGQTFYAAVGFAQNQARDLLPTEWSAQCVVH